MRLQQNFDQGDFILADDQKSVRNHQQGRWIETDKASLRASWCAYQSESGIPITIALFDHPDNIRFPATWFLMSEPYALPVATIDPFRQHLTLNPENGLDLCYGIALWDGLTRKEHIDQLYKRWIDLTDLLLD
jgi:hypothetical protein